MAALTWRDVAAPNFSSSNEAFRNSSSQMSQALAGLGETLKNFQTERQAGIDGAILGKALQIQDPAQMRQALQQGTLLQGVDLSKVNPQILSQLDGRTGKLLNQAATEQNIASSKLGDTRTQQAIDNTNYDQGRKVQENELGDAAREQGGALFGSTGPVAKLSLEEQQRIAQGRSSLATQAIGRAATSLGMDQTRQNMSQSATNFGNAQTDRNENREALTTADNIMRASATQEDARGELDDMSDQNPVVRAKANRLLGDTFGNLYAPVDAAPAAGKGGKPGTGSPTTDGPAQAGSKIAQAALAETQRRVSQNSSAGVVADIEKNLGNTQNTAEVAGEIAKLYPEGDTGKIAGRLAKAMSDNPGLSAADAGSALLRSTRNSAWWRPGTTNLGDGIGIDDGAFQANLESLKTGKADYMSAGNKETRALGSAIKSADDELTAARTALSAIQRRQRTQTNVDPSRAEARVKRAEQKLADAVEKQQGDPRYMPQYVVPEVPVAEDPAAAVDGLQSLFQAGRKRRGE